MQQFEGVPAGRRLLLRYTSAQPCWPGNLIRPFLDVSCAIRAPPVLSILAHPCILSASGSDFPGLQRVRRFVLQGDAAVTGSNGPLHAPLQAGPAHSHRILLAEQLVSAYRLTIL